MSEEQAVKYFQQLIDESVNAVAAVMAEQIHKWAQVSLSICCCAAVLLCCCAAVLLCCCAAVLLCCCAAVLLCRHVSK